MTNPYAKALRVKPQQVIGDKREALTIRALWDETANEPLPDDFNEILRSLDEQAPSHLPRDKRPTGA